MVPKIPLPANAKPAPSPSCPPCRRHDTPNERAMVGARMANLKAGGEAGVHKTNSSVETLLPAVTITRAAELAKTSSASIKRAKPIVNTGIPELQSMAESQRAMVAAKWARLKNGEVGNGRVGSLIGEATQTKTRNEAAGGSVPGAGAGPATGRDLFLHPPRANFKRPRHDGRDP